MKEVETRHGPGLIGLIMSSEVGRYQYTNMALDKLEVPRGTQLEPIWSCNPARNCNLLIEEMLKHKQYQWLWFMGDDHMFEPDCLLRLLNHDVDCVMPITPRRSFPYDPVIWRTHHPETGDNRWYTWNDLEKFKDRLVPVAAGGQAGLLVKRRVFESMEAPWFHVGWLYKDDLQEDIFFTRRCNERGYPVYADPMNIMGHIITSIVFPKWTPDGQLGIAMNLNGHKQFIIPPGYTALEGPDGVSLCKIPQDWINKPDLINQRAAGTPFSALLPMGSPDEARPARVHNPLVSA